VRLYRQEITTRLSCRFNFLAIRGYVITIKAVDVTGKLDGGYENPNPLPFYTGVATSDGGVLKLFFELRAGGYGGSTYTLTFDATDDRLKGVYYQAVAKQKFEVVFDRAR